jgi:hypothetical protein
MTVYRTISHLIKIFLLPEIEKRIKNGTIKENDLPLEIIQFRAIQKKQSDGNVLPIVELNQEVNIIVEFKCKRAISAGELLTIDDIYSEESFIRPPIYNGEPAAYFLCQSIFFDYFLLHDCRPNFPDITEEELKEIKIPYPILEILNNKKLYEEINPVEKIKLLSDNNWPPAPGYYPTVLLTIHQNPTILNSPSILGIISNNYGISYWDKRFAFWDETDFYPDRLPYLKRAKEAHFDNDYIASIYVLVPQFEGIITDYLIECGITPNERFKKCVEDLEKLILSRKVLMFPKEVLEIIFDYLANGSFWKRSKTISNPSTTINRHGIAHGVYTGFESEELSLKYLILLDLLSFILLHDKMLRQSI